jgi:putative ABC transport system substrate-binding protein
MCQQERTGDQMKVVSSQWSVVKKSVFGFALCALPFALGFPAEAQHAKKVYRIGYLANPSGIESTEEILRQSLRDLGYVEGKNLIIEWRFSKGDVTRHPAFAADLVALQVDCIVSIGVLPTRAAKEATSTIPIVMGNADDDPVRRGLVASLARPGGNVTGFFNIGSDLAAKRLELLKEAVPKASRVAILFDPASVAAVFAKETEAASGVLGVRLQPVEVRVPGDLEAAFQAAIKEQADALLVVHTGLFATLRTQSVKLAAKMRLPAMYSTSLFVLAGGLMSYDADNEDRIRGVAGYVDKILKGARPADLPVVGPRKFNLTINLKTAKQIGLTIPPNFLARADRVIK